MTEPQTTADDGPPPAFEGGCACGAVRFSLAGAPRRAGLCHCLTCRKAHAAAFNPFVVFTACQMTTRGTPQAWRSSPGYVRWFCPTCGSRVWATLDEEVEVSLGSFDAPGLVVPQYESWIVRREPWVAQLDAPQFARDRAPSDGF